MSARRVVITGLGVISSLGQNALQFWDRLSQGIPAIGPIGSVDCSRLRFRNGAEVRGFNPTHHFDEDQSRVLDRFAQFGIVAAREAVKSAGLEWSPRLCARTGVITGSALGGQKTEDESFAELYLRGAPRVHPLSIPRIMANALASHISMHYSITGPVYTVTTACSSANHAIGQAFWLIRQGMIDAALAGGSEAPFSFGNLKAWEAMRVIAPDTCRPFSKSRQGMILGEGGAILVLESREMAISRGAVILAEITGFGMSSDAYHLTQPKPEGAAQAMKAALADAGLPPEKIGYINTHGTGTVANDACEAAAIAMTFGSHTDRLAVSSTKSMHGHALGAAGALEAVATILSLRNSLLPPTVNFIDRDPLCDLDVVPNVPREASCEYAMSNSFAFGGLNATLVFRKWC